MTSLLAALATVGCGCSVAGSTGCGARSEDGPALSRPSGCGTGQCFWAEDSLTCAVGAALDQLSDALRSCGDSKAG